MKKLTLFTTIALTLISFNGCNKLSEDAKHSYNNVLQESIAIKENIEKTKDKALETAQDIQDAANAVKNAKEAIDEITK